MWLTARTVLLLPLLNYFAGKDLREQHTTKREPQRLQFELRHQHAVSPDAHVVFSDVGPAARNLAGGNQTTYSLWTRNTTSFRPPSFSEHEAARIRSMRHAQSADFPWHEDEIIGPNIESQETILELAKMTNNAYVTPDDPVWYELSERWTNVSHSDCPSDWSIDSLSDLG
jgi:lipase ATG15